MAYGKISAKQMEILEFVKSEILTKGYPPSVREICDAVNLKSTSSVHSHLETLEKNGYIRRDPTKPRTIEIMDESFQKLRINMVNVPIIGNMVKEIPINSAQNITGYFPIPADMVPKGDSFVLKIIDESMVKAGIFNGDNIFVQSTNTAKNGDTVVALVDNTVIVSTYYKENGHFRLQPENDSKSALILDNVTILGKVFAVFRLYK